MDVTLEGGEPATENLAHDAKRVFRGWAKASFEIGILGKNGAYCFRPHDDSLADAPPGLRRAVSELRGVWVANVFERLCSLKTEPIAECQRCGRCSSTDRHRVLDWFDLTCGVICNNCGNVVGFDWCGFSHLYWGAPT